MPRKSVRALWASKVKDGVFQKDTGAALSQSVRRTPFRGLVLGIDPSLRGTGLAVVEFRKSLSPQLIFSETVKNGSQLDLAHCLAAIARSIDEVLDRFPIDACGIEETIYVQNFQTAQILGAARGAAIATVAKRGIEIEHYSPLRIKQAVVGFGRASKEQVANQMRSLLVLPANLSFDESDAAAIACCHAFSISRGF